MTQEIKDAYEILNIKEGSTNVEEIKSNYKKLVRENHPDRINNPTEKQLDFFRTLTYLYDSLLVYITDVKNTKPELESYKEFTEPRFNIISCSWERDQDTKKKVVKIRYSTQSVLGVNFLNRKGFAPQDVPESPYKFYEKEVTIPYEKVKERDFILEVFVHYYNKYVYDVKIIRNQFTVPESEGFLNKFSYWIKTLSDKLFSFFRKDNINNN